LVGDNDLGNAELDALVDATGERPGPDIVTYDAYESVRDMAANPGRHGLTNTKNECIQVPACISESYDTGLGVANGFVHWDGAHYTTRAHQIMGEQLLRMLR
jgi:phospholipase/lecithinase/hemolysin